uniref:VWA domain-containing protein n=1 Tax=Desulfacinum infernum TaxID=35837 RepID=A0A832A4T9_9BACT
MSRACRKKGEPPGGRSVPWITVLALVLMLSVGAAWAQSTSTNMVIVVDRSGSMKEPGGDPEGLGRAAVEFLLDQLELAGPENRAAVLPFSTMVKAIPTEGVTSDFENAIRPHLGVLAEVDGYTDLEEALRQGLRRLDGAEGRKQMVLISDGQPEPDFQSARVAERFPEQYRKFRSNPKAEKSLKEQMAQMSSEQIQRFLFGLLKEKGIEVYPLALTGIEAHGEDLLRNMAVQVTQDAAAFKKTLSRDLLRALEEIVPKPPSVLTVFKASFDQGGHKQWSTAFQLQEPVKMLRILIMYGEKPSGVTWHLQGPAGSIQPNQPGSARYAAAKDKNGKGDVIFERLFLDAPPLGTYRIDFESKGFLPGIKVIVDARTDWTLSVQTRPDPGEVGVPVEIFCGLTGARSQGLKSGQVEIVDPKGMPVGEPLVLQEAQNGVVQGRWTPSTAGTHLLKVVGYLDPDRTRSLAAKHLVHVKPRQAVSLRLLVPTATAPVSSGPPPRERLKGPSYDHRGEVLDFQTFTATRTQYQIEGIRVEQSSHRAVPVVVTVENLRHEESNFTLDPEAWCTVQPNQGATSAASPFHFNLTLRLPANLPVGLPDGAYTGTVRVVSPEAEQPVHKLVRFTIDLPDFQTVPADVAQKGLRMAFACCLPDHHSVSFAVTTDAAKDQQVSLIPPMVLVREGTDESVSDEQAQVCVRGCDVPEKTVTVAGHDRGPTKITLDGYVHSAALPSGNYQGDVMVRSQLGRTLYIPVTLSIPSRFWVDHIRPAALGGLGVALLGLFFGPARLWRARRGRFAGTTLTITRQANGRVAVPEPWNQIVDVTYVDQPQKAWLIRSQRATVTPLRPQPGMPPGQVLIPINSVGSFSVRFGGNYQFGTRSASTHRLQLRLRSSPYRRRGILTWFGLLSVTALGCGFLSYWPQWVCRWVP